MRKSITFLFFSLAMSALPFSGLAQVPGTLSYQGILMQSDGITPISDGAHSIVFNFYTVSTGGSTLFSRTVSVTTAKGLYTCIVGGGTGANAPFNASEMNQVGSQQVYIGINVDAGGELSPRAQLTTSPYSMMAQSITHTNNPTGGNVSFWGANNTLSSDAGFFWDNTVNKRLGLGTTSPVARLHIFGSAVGTDDDLFLESINSVGTAQSSSLRLRRSRGSVGAPGGALASDVLGRIAMAGNFGTTLNDYVDGSQILTIAEQNFTSDVNTQDAALTFNTASNGTLNERMRITSAGNLEINGFTKLGDASVPIKTCVVTGTTSGSSGGATDVTLCGGAVKSKVLSVTVLVLNDSGSLIPSSTESSATQSRFYWSVTGTATLRVRNGDSPNAADILGKAFTAYVTYME